MKYQKSCNLLNPRFSLVTTNAKNANSYYQYCFPWERRRLDFRMRGRVRATCGVRLPMTAAMASRSDTHQLPAIRGMLLHPAKSRETMTAYLGSCHRLALDRRTERGRLEALDFLYSGRSRQRRVKFPNGRPACYRVRRCRLRKKTRHQKARCATRRASLCAIF